jgi:hypothetical protein
MRSPRQDGREERRDVHQFRGDQERPQVLHRRQLGRSDRPGQMGGRQPGDRRPDCRNRPRQRRRRRSSRGCGAGCLPRLRPDQPQGTARPPQAHPRRLHGALRRVRQHHLARDGCADAALPRSAGAGGGGAYRRDDARPRDLRIRDAPRDHHAGARTGRRRRRDHAMELADQPRRSPRAARSS